MSKSHLEEINMVCDFLRSSPTIAEKAFMALTNDGFTPSFPVDCKHMGLCFQKYLKKT